MKHPRNELITLTFGDMAENHVGMEQIGSMVEEGLGFHLPDLQQIQQTMENMGVLCELHTLSHGEQPAAYVLVLKEGVTALLSHHSISQMDIFNEQTTLDYDKKAFMYGRVVNKHARWNLCFDNESRDPEYAAGKGRIIGYSKVPYLNQLKVQLETMMGPKAHGLKIESNYYYDTEKTGIGYHGDGERRKVIGVRVGYASMPMYWQWFKEGRPVGEPILVPLNPGDIYIMSEKAVGTDWKMKKPYTLRHATGCKKYTHGM